MHSGNPKIKKRGRPSNDNTDNVTPPKRRTPIMLPTTDVRFDGLAHLLDMLEKKGRCKVCQGTTQLVCTKCKINLCLTVKKSVSPSFT